MYEYKEEKTLNHNHHSTKLLFLFQIIFEHMQPMVAKRWLNEAILVPSYQAVRCSSVLINMWFWFELKQ